MLSRQGSRIWVAAAVTVVGALTAASLRSAGNDPYSGKEWAAPGGDWGSTRYSTLAQINTRNIKQLGGAWVVETPDRAEATPMVKDGRMFVVTTAGVIMALDPATGATLWTFKPETPFSGKRGIGIGDGLLFSLGRIIQGAHFARATIWSAAIDGTVCAALFLPLLCRTTRAA